MRCAAASGAAAGGGGAAAGAAGAVAAVAAACDSAEVKGEGRGLVARAPCREEMHARSSCAHSKQTKDNPTRRKMAAPPQAVLGGAGAAAAVVTKPGWGRATERPLLRQAHRRRPAATGRGRTRQASVGLRAAAAVARRVRAGAYPPSPSRAGQVGGVLLQPGGKPAEALAERGGKGRRGGGGAAAAVGKGGGVGGPTRSCGPARARVRVRRGGGGPDRHRPRAGQYGYRCCCVGTDAGQAGKGRRVGRHGRRGCNSLGKPRGRRGGGAHVPAGGQGRAQTATRAAHAERVRRSGLPGRRRDAIAGIGKGVHDRHRRRTAWGCCGRSGSRYSQWSRCSCCLWVELRARLRGDAGGRWCMWAACRAVRGRRVLPASGRLRRHACIMPNSALGYDGQPGRVSRVSRRHARESGAIGVGPVPKPGQTVAVQAPHAAATRPSSPGVALVRHRAARWLKGAMRPLSAPQLASGQEALP
jgi:hypothetical protein